MVRFAAEVVAVVVASALIQQSEGFQQRTCFRRPAPSTNSKDRNSVKTTASLPSDFAAWSNVDSDDDQKWRSNFSAGGYLDSLSPRTVEEEEEEEEERFEYGPARTTKAVGSRISATDGTYAVSLPISGVSASFDADLSFVGMSLRRVATGGALSSTAYSLDSQRMYDAEMVSANRRSVEEEDENNRLLVLDDASVPAMFDGIVVSELFEGGKAYNAGVRVGDEIVATSATMGEKLWPKSTLEGIQSAIQSRRIISSDMTFQFRRPRTATEATEMETVTEFELELSSPMGIKVADTKNCVQIVGFSEESKAKDFLRIGDTIVAVESAFGKKMWPVSTVEGVTSAITTRRPGTTVKIRFRRIVDVKKWENTIATATSTPDVKASKAAGSSVSTSTTATNAVAVTNEQHRVLLSRSRDLLLRYKNSSQSSSTALKNVAAVVADRVLEALAAASAPLDAEILAMVMNAYTSCRFPHKAVLAFESAVGLPADASVGNAESASTMANPAALDLSVATSLLRAHALRGDYRAASRVLAAITGDSSLTTDVDGVVSWPLSSKPDARCYNTVLAAATKVGGRDGLAVAEDIFERMVDAGVSSAKSDDGSVVRTAVSYNTMIALFAKEGRPQDALNVFYGMKQAGVKPDKFSYTSLMKALVEDGDFDGGQELILEMRERRIEIDVVTYNTMIKGLCDRLLWFRAKELVSEMEANGVRPDSMTYCLLMNGLLKADRPGPCLTLFEAAYADRRTTVLTENVRLYTTAITAASRVGDHERAVELVARMKKVGVRPNLRTLTSLMSACLRAGKVDGALSVYDQIVRLADVDKSGESFRVDGLVLSLAIRAHCGRGAFAEAAKILSAQKDGYREMSGKEIMSGYNHIINAALLSREFDAARASLTELLQSGYIPSKVTFEEIVKGLEMDTRIKQETVSEDEIVTSKENVEFLLFVIDSLAERNLAMGGSFYAALVNECVRVGGLGKKVASLLVSCRAQTMEGRSLHATTATTTNPSGSDEDRSSWLDIYEEIESRRSGGAAKNDYDSKNLPTLRVNIGKKNSRQVFAAERVVSYTSRRQRLPQNRRRERSMV